MFLSDIDKFFLDRGARGIPLDARNDVLTLMFADDLVFFCEHEVWAQKAANILKEYVKLKGLTVNILKSKVVVCKEGRSSAKPIKIMLGKDKIDVVKSYIYLGIEIAGSAVGLQATRTAVQKARIACGTALSILVKAKSDSWPSNLRIFDAIVARP